MRRLVIVSNRVMPPEGPSAAGGLAVALGAAVRGRPTLWFGWSGERRALFTGEVTSRRDGDLEVATLDLDEADYAEFYNGYANGALWPLLHWRTDLADFNTAFSQAYWRANRRFAEALSPRLAPDDVVWVHDYHLIPLGGELRRLGFDGPIGFFLHIPWPAPQVMTALPDHLRLAEALFAYDLVGLQADEHVGLLEAYLVGEAGAASTDAGLCAFGRRLRLGSFPIGLDTDDFLALTDAPAAHRAYERLAAHGVFRSLIVGVDRMDYAKGLEERLLGFEHFLERRSDMVRKVIYLQIAPTSREDVEAYQDLRIRVLALSGRINAVWADIDHTPLQCVNRNYSRAELAGIYRAARVGLVTPLRDGMNLVAKEYVAAQDPADPGVLILSRFAGAASQMADALIVNPYSRDEVAGALESALVMDLAERRKRWERLMAGVRHDSVDAWRDRFLDALMATQAPEAERPRRAAFKIGTGETHGLLQARDLSGKAGLLEDAGTQRRKGRAGRRAPSLRHPGA
jgi:trehalose 6-phosphate synthase